MDQFVFPLQITLTTTWKEVKKVIKEDPRCIKFSSSDRVRNNISNIVFFRAHLFQNIKNHSSDSGKPNFITQVVNK